MRRTRSALATIAAAGLIATACGSDDPDPADAPAVTDDDMSEEPMEDEMSEEPMEDDMSDDG